MELDKDFREFIELLNAHDDMLHNSQGVEPEPNSGSTLKQKEC
jgi:hypothetical protein